MTLFDYSPITERPPPAWPDGKRVAFYVGLDIEHFLPDVRLTTSDEIAAHYTASSTPSSASTA